MKELSGRRHFIKTTAGLIVAFAATSFDPKRNKLLLSFSTLGCPNWTFETILNFAVSNGYSGIELSVMQKQKDLPKCAEFNTRENTLATRKLIEEKNLRIVDLCSFAAMHYADPAERTKNLDEAKRFIQLAQQLNCPYVRVFPNEFPKEQERNVTIDLIVKGLLELGDYAKDYGATVLMETHGNLVESGEIEKIMKLATHPNVGLVWDVVNMWSVTKEPAARVYARLKKYIRHVQLKDLRFMDGREQYVLLGKGDVPIFEAIDVLAKDGYNGYYSFEWEKFWHAEIAEPEVAIADYSKVMRQHFNK